MSHTLEFLESDKSDMNRAPMEARGVGTQSPGAAPRAVPSSNRPPHGARGPAPVREAWRQALIAEHYELVRAIARRLASGLPRDVELDDLVSAGTLGLIEAAERFEIGRGVGFRTFAQARIRGAMVDSLRSNDWVPAGVRHRAEELRKTREALTGELGHAPDLADVARTMHMPADKVRRMQAGAQVLSLVSTETPLGEDGGDTIGCMLGGFDDPIDRLASNELGELMTDALATLPERERMAVEMYYFGERTLEDIAATMGVALSRAYQLRCRGVERLRYRVQRHAVV